MYLLGVAIYLLGIFLTMFFKAVPFGVLINPAAICINLLPLLAVLTATKGFTLFWGGLKAAALKKSALSKESRKKAAAVFHLLSRTTILSSAVGLAIGGIAALTQYAAAPDLLPQALSAALVVPFWGMMLITALFEPVAFILKRRQDAEH